MKVVKRIVGQGGAGKAEVSERTPSKTCQVMSERREAGKILYRRLSETIIERKDLREGVVGGKWRGGPLKK